ncbi:ABC transporter ATP-binding protein [Pseudotabrizicola sediminis]|uniref:ABC transporter ATP-binding protein n=1 Tax=Pseudotabrizicola sediminis TaxID=2486418 RepID=A0ABY2KHC3_9RHOB|nr:ABC-F family ATP-binding cassette domain-containing protein [Pseudotabrizicola sediminis]TGD41681.1 ABC transporter ATP-binding protein [Pseudotabrizicola sediminis]
MLKIEGISYSVEGRPLFDQASADIPAGHKIGLVGRNGAGKTTLFRLIRGELALEDGEIHLPPGSRIGGVAQEVPSSATSLLDTVLGADAERTALLAEADTTKDPMRIAEVQTRLADIDAWSAEARASAILKGLGFDTLAQGRPCSDFSGGWRMRVALAGVLFAQPDILLLDEPTNYLDLEGAIWLEDYLQKYPHTVIIISHDRALLNRAVGAILHLEDGKLTLYSGPYDQFARQREEQRAVRTASARKQDMRRAHLQGFVDRFRYQANKARQAQSRIKMLERMVPISAPEDRATIAFSFPAPEEMSPPLVTLEDAAVGYDGPPVLKGMNLRIDPDDRIALLGRNGEGKSTLSKLLAGKLPLASGQMAKSGKLRIGYFAQHQVDELQLYESPLQHLDRLLPTEGKSKLRARLAGFGLGADHAETIVDRLSGGQKARLSLVLATLDAPHLLILDEPTNHLDIESREALVDALTSYNGAVILVSHDMHLLGLVADRLWLVNAGSVAPYEDDLDGYRSFLLGIGAPVEPQKAKGAPPQKPSRVVFAQLKAEVRACETRIATLNDMRDTLALKLADPGLYAPDMESQAQIWQSKYAEVMDGLDRAEALWVAALQALENAQAAS